MIFSKISQELQNVVNSLQALQKQNVLISKEIEQIEKNTRPLSIARPTFWKLVRTNAEIIVALISVVVSMYLGWTANNLSSAALSISQRQDSDHTQIDTLRSIAVNSGKQLDLLTGIAYKQSQSLDTLSRLVTQNILAIRELKKQNTSLEGINGKILSQLKASQEQTEILSSQLGLLVLQDSVQTLPQALLLKEKLNTIMIEVNRSSRFSTIGGLDSFTMNVRRMVKDFKQLYSTNLFLIKNQ